MVVVMSGESTDVPPGALGPGGRPDERAAAAKDRLLISEIARGEVAALGELFDRHAQRCWAAASSLTADADLAADALEAAFLQVWREPPTHAADRLGSHLIHQTWRQLSG